MFYFLSFLLGLFIGYKISMIGIEDERNAHRNIVMLLNETLNEKR